MSIMSMQPLSKASHIYFYSKQVRADCDKHCSSRTCEDGITTYGFSDGSGLAIDEQGNVTQTTVANRPVSKEWLQRKKLYRTYAQD